MTTSSSKNDTPSGIAKHWLQRVRAQPDQSLPKSTRYGLRTKSLGPYRFLIADTYEISADTTWWTTDQDKAQVYYDLEHAFRCAGILASITNQDVEVVALD
jgi:hypothetical protein